jgi:hypothetical protein
LFTVKNCRNLRRPQRPGGGAEDISVAEGARRRPALAVDRQERHAVGESARRFGQLLERKPVLLRIAVLRPGSRTRSRSRGLSRRDRDFHQRAACHFAPGPPGHAPRPALRRLGGEDARDAAALLPNRDPERCPVRMGPSEAISIVRGIEAFTTEAAWQYGLEKQLGSIATGKIADLVILSDDPLSNGRPSRRSGDDPGPRHGPSCQSARRQSADLAAIRHNIARERNSSRSSAIAVPGRNISGV